MGLVDGIIKEPLGGAPSDVKGMIQTLKKTILKETEALEKLSPEERIAQRIEKFGAMGVHNE